MKNISVLILSVSIIIFVILACKSPENKQNQNTSTTSKETPKPNDSSFDQYVTLTFKIETNDTRKPKIVGETNLPDGTQLMFSIEGKSVNYNGQDKSTVSNGKFESSTFSLNNGELNEGQYKAEVSMPIAEVQPASVRSVIGEKGEKLKGSLVKKRDLGVTVSVEKPFQLKKDGSIIFAENKTEIENTTKNALTIFDSLKKLEQQGREMESLRKNETTENIKQCGVLMRERQPIADELRSKSEALPQPYSILLTPAAIELKLCVSCMSSAIENCNRAKSSLEQASKEMTKNK